MKKYLLILLVFAACNTVKKQQRKAENFFTENPGVSSKWCAENYPVKTVYKPGETIFKSDTITIKGDSVPCPPYVDSKGDTVYVKVKCPDNKIIHDTALRIDTFFQTNTALAAYLSFQNDSLKTELNKTTALKEQAEKHAKTRLWILIIISGAVTGFIILKIKKFIL